MQQTLAISQRVRPRALRGRLHLRAFVGCSLLVMAALAVHPAHSPSPRPAILAAAPSAPASRAVAFDAVLDSADIVAYRAALSAQKKGEWAEANALLLQVHSPVLQPTLLAQRFLDGRVRPTEKALKAWLDQYATHPKYTAVLARAAQLYPEQFAALEEASAMDDAPLPRARGGLMASESTLRYGGSHSYAMLPSAERDTISRLIDEAQARLENGKPTADAVLAGSRSLSPLGQEVARWELANLQFAYGNMNEAWRLASPAAERRTATLPAMHWVAGMAAWELGRYTDAHHHFDAMARRRQQLPAGDMAAAAFWAARAAHQLGKKEETLAWLRVSAAGQNAFYAQLARHVLGKPAPGGSPLLVHTKLLAQSKADREWLEAQPGAKRALAWHVLGEEKLAQWELAEAFAAAGPTDKAILAHLAGALDFTDLQLAMAQELPKELATAASYPIPSWTPKPGFELEQALLLGIARQESGFNPAATSNAGASGLMQLMPQTARYVAALAPYAANARARTEVALRDPVTNLSLGQRYLQYLAAKPYVENNLILLLAAYNAGPKAAIQWSNRQQDAADPLAFIERISYSQTRAYVQYVLANSWAYHDLLGTEAASLTALSRGQWPQLTQTKPWRLAQRTDTAPARVN